MNRLFSNKNRILTGCLLITVSTLVSCKKLVQVPDNPSTSITQAEQFADSTTAMSDIAGVYTYKAGNGFAFSNANLTISAGLSADELSFTGTSDQQQFYSYTLTPLNNEIITLWSYPYQSMFQVNDALNGVTNNNNLSASFIKQIIGEMKVVRALYYFNLVNLFGGVPLVTSTDYNITSQLPRASVSAVYTQIIADLTDARQKLSASYPSAGKARPNLYTAIALLAKVHLYQGNWQAAYNEADSIIKSNTYTLTDSLKNVFLDGSTEAIWQLPAQGLYSSTADANSFVPSSSTTTPSYLLTPFLLNQFEAGDLRRQKWVGTNNVTTTVAGVPTVKQYYYPFKYKNRQATATPVEDFMIFRLGEIYLIRAEAAAELNNLSGALADVNIIRARAGLAASTANITSQTAILAAVMKERQTEMCFEWGNRWYDLKRTDTSGTVLTAEKTGWQANAALYPIPQGQIQLNNLLIQNPGYN